MKSNRSFCPYKFLSICLFFSIAAHHASASNHFNGACEIIVDQQISAFNGSDGIATAFFDSGNAPFTYLWSNGVTTRSAVNLSAGTYTVTITDDTGASCSSEVTLAGPSRIQNFIFEDINGNGIQDEADVPIKGISVNLLDNNGNTLGTTASDDFGFYAFDGLFAGNYRVSIELAQGYVFSHQNIGNDSAIDNDFSDSRSDIINLDNNELFTNLDAGLFLPGSIGNFVFNDANKNGLQDPNETGIPNIAITITGTDAVGNSFHQSTFSNTEGFYSFNNLKPGSYILHFSQPQNMEISPAAQGTDSTIDSDINPVSGESPTIHIRSGEYVDSVDGGFSFDTANIKSFAFRDNNANGVLDSGDDLLRNIPVNLYAENIGNLVSREFTNSQGYFHFQNLDQNLNYILEFDVPDNHIVTTQTTSANSGISNLSSIQETNARTELIFLNSAFNDFNIFAGFIPLSGIAGVTYKDENENGQFDNSGQDILLNGINVKLTMHTMAENIFIDEIVTAANGTFSFNKLDPRNYYSLDFIDTNAQLSGAPLENRILQPGEILTDQNAALYFSSSTFASIGDYTFFDVNENGIQDAEDEPLPGVNISLYFASDPNTKLLETISDEFGFYRFENLQPNKEYILKFIPPDDFLPTIQIGTAMDQYPDNSDINESTFLTTVIWIADNEDNVSFDAGFISLNPDIGEFVWFDINENGIQDDGQAGVPNVLIELVTLETDNVVKSATTNNGGFYTIRNAPPGNYYLRFRNIPQSYTFTQKDNFIDGLDSDVNLSGKTDPFTIVAAQPENLKFDVGLVPGVLVPVELIHFSTKTINDDEVLIQWSTANESRNEKFVVERSANGKDFEALAVKAGKGTTSTRQDYSFTDKSPLFGNNYYRLKQVDFNGDFVYSNIESATILANAKNEMLVYPNPTPDVTFVKSVNPLTQDIGIKLQDSNGHELLFNQMKEGDQLQEINLSDFAPGTYYITIIFENKTNSQFKIIKTAF